VPGDIYGFRIFAIGQGARSDRVAKVLEGTTSFLFGHAITPFLVSVFDLQNSAVWLLDGPAKSKGSTRLKEIHEWLYPCRKIMASPSGSPLSA
jgi:hypothetical protein